MKASLSSERWEQVHHLFNEVVDLDPDARAARLDPACHDDPALREEVESLLTAYLQADDLLEVLDQIAGSSSQPSAARPSFTGARVAHYEVLERLGGGGMGVVYKALDTRLKRIVALKFLPPQWSQDARAKQRFEHEAQAASALDHPNICTIHEIGETDDGQLFIAMAYYDGQTLKKKIKQGPLPLDDALDIATQIARGLAKAHTRDIVHRDIKPANVMITDDGVVKIVDFGLAKMADVQMTKTGTTMGTVAYMSPQQTRGEGVDHRADVWSLGVVLYEMLTGERPFKGDYDQAIIYSLLNEDPASITEINPELPEEVEHVVTMCLEKEKDLRYPSVADLLADLEVLTQDPGSALLSSTGSGASLYAMQRRQPRIPRKAIVVGAGVLAVLLVVLAMLWGGGKAALPTQRYLAVLPFTFADTDLEADQAFADGLEETFRNKLAQLEQFQDSLWVVPTEDMASNPVASPGEARQIFGVNLVVEGQVERIEEVIRLTLTLVDTKTLQKQRSEKVEGQGAEDAAFQAGLLTTITDLLDLDLSPQVRRSLSVGETTESAAYV
ncbi:MAG: protein kinase [Rhodothermales bacterium]